MLKKLCLVLVVFGAVSVLITVVIAAATLITLPTSTSDPDAVPGEPGCHGILWAKDCDGQDMYRLVYNSTTTPTVDNVRAAMLGAYAPVQASTPWNNRLRAAVEMQYSQISEGTASCYRESTLGFIAKNTEDRKVTGEAVAVAKAALSLYENAAPAQYSIGVSGVTGMYGDAMDAARTLSISEAAYGQATADIAGCM
jgi:hypothetical protein